MFSACPTVGCVLKVLKREGTVAPAPNFSASGDAAVLDKAIKVKGEAAEASWLHLAQTQLQMDFIH